MAYRRRMSSLRTHFERRAAAVSDCATADVVGADDALTCWLRPHNPNAVGVVLYVAFGRYGTVALDDPACAPAELGDDAEADEQAIDYLIDVAVEGRATAFHIGSGGCVEVRPEDTVSRTWLNAWPLPGWRRRAERVDYMPYR